MGTSTSSYTNLKAMSDTLQGVQMAVEQNKNAQELAKIGKELKGMEKDIIPDKKELEEGISNLREIQQTAEETTEMITQTMETFSESTDSTEIQDELRAELMAEIEVEVEVEKEKEDKLKKKLKEAQTN